jgi:predicted dehydrogenase
MPSQVKIALVGLNFGSAFVSIYRDHPFVSDVVLCEQNQAVLDRVGDEHQIAARFTSYDALLADRSIDAVHLFTPVPLHAAMSLQALDAGKHCACAVPSATTLEELTQVVEAARRNGRNYMLMETGVYNREFLYVKDMLERGELGNLTFLVGEYYQDLECDYPRYWWSVPPMHYATHSLSPLIALSGTTVRRVCCLGSGTLKPSLQQPGGNRFPIQTAIFSLNESDVAIQLNRAWFQIARSFCEGFSVYGDLRGYEWQQIESEEPVVYTLPEPDMSIRWHNAEAVRVKVPARPDLLPEPLRQYADGGHGGSHPHLAHEFITSIVENRDPWPGPLEAAHWTAAGICADLSSKQDGEPVSVPVFG